MTEDGQVRTELTPDARVAGEWLAETLIGQRMWWEAWRKG